MVREIYDSRASAILCNFLKSNSFSKPFLISSNVCPTIPLCFIKSKVDYEFIDIDLKTHAMDIGILISKLSTGKYQGVLFVHSYGRSFNVDTLYKEIKSINKSLIIIDDRCLCIPIFNKVNSYADLTLFSTGYSKYVDLGYGGFAYMDAELEYTKNMWNYDSILENKLINDIKYALENNLTMQINDTNWLKSEDFDFSEYKLKIVGKLEEVAKHKEYINNIYKSCLDEEICWEQDYQNWRFNISIKPEKRDFLLKRIFEAGFFAGTNYPSLSYLFRGTRSLNAELEAKSVINLFNNYKADESYAEGVVNIINDFMKYSYK